MLKKIGDARAVDALIDGLLGNNWMVRRHAAEAFECVSPVLPGADEVTKAPGEQEFRPSRWLPGKVRLMATPCW